jgi:hypothetical protein
MSSLFRRLYHAWLTASIGLAVAGCVTMSPGIRACHAGPPSIAQTDHSDPLRILPSQVPGLVLDSALWFSISGTEDLGIHGRGLPRPHAHHRQRPSRRRCDRVPRREHRRANAHVTGQSTATSTNTDWVHDCPAAAQAIWRRHIPLAFGLDERAARRLERLPNAGSVGDDPVRIIVDTVITFHGDYATQSFAAVVIQNPSGQSTDGVTVAFLTEQRSQIRHGGFTAPEAIMRRDSVGAPAPGERRTILGPLVNGGDYALGAVRIRCRGCQLEGRARSAGRRRVPMRTVTTGSPRPEFPSPSSFRS